MTARAAFDVAFAQCPLIAILRGIRPAEAVEIATSLHQAGFRLIEVPLNSPDPFESIARIGAALGEQVLVGAGTVTNVAQVEELARIGGKLVLSPHFDAEILRATIRAGMVSMPGTMSPTEAFGAIEAGADILKLFPMEMIGVSGVKALRAVLPKNLSIIGVGGVDETNMAVFRSAGCHGFGLGSTLYKPGDCADQVAARAIQLRTAFRN